MRLPCSRPGGRRHRRGEPADAPRVSPAGSRVLALALAALLLACAGGAERPQPITAAAAWQPGMTLVQKLREQCSFAYVRSPVECFAHGLGAFGAPPAAVAAAARLPQPGFVRDVRPGQPVSVAYVDYPYRANQNQAWLLVNGDPPVIDVDDLTRLDQASLRADPAFAAIAAVHPRVDLWPGDRGATGGPEIADRAGGGQRFIVDYRLQDGCHACAILGTVRYAFDVDGAGRFLGTQLISVQPSATPR